MQVIRCTKKLQKEMGLKKENISMTEPIDSQLGSWHANLLYIDRRKCILFVNDKTFFNFIIPDVPRSIIRNLSQIFKEYLSCVINDEDLSDDAKKKIIEEYSDLKYANTNNRKVIGVMNNLAWHYESHIRYEGGVHSSAVPGIIKKLNRMPMSTIKYAFPYEELKSLYSCEEDERE